MTETQDDKAPEKLPVLFRKRMGKITAVFPTVNWSSESDMACYVHVGQHGACDFGWYNKTKAAKPDEYAELLAELRAIYECRLGPEDTVYRLVVYRRMQPWMHRAREKMAREIRESLRLEMVS